MIKIDSAIDLIFRKVSSNRHIFGQYENAVALKAHHDETGKWCENIASHSCVLPFWTYAILFLATEV